MKICSIKYYGGARDKVSRLGLADVFLEILQVLFDTRIALEESNQANGAAVIREAVDTNIEKATGWTKIQAGGVDWSKQRRYNETFVSKIGVEIQLSSRSDLLIRDVVHLRNSLQTAEIDVGIIVVPSDRMQRFLPDRTPSFRDAVRYIEQEFKEATTFPIVLLAVEHDGIGPPLPKRKRKS